MRGLRCRLLDNGTCCNIEQRGATQYNTGRCSTAGSNARTPPETAGRAAPMLQHVAPCCTSITHRKLPVRSEAPGRNKNVARKSAEYVPHTRGGIITDYRGQGSLERTLTRTHARTCGTSEPYASTTTFWLLGLSTSAGGPSHERHHRAHSACRSPASGERAHPCSE